MPANADRESFAPWHRKGPHTGERRFWPSRYDEALACGGGFRPSEDQRRGMEMSGIPVRLARGTARRPVCLSIGLSTASCRLEEVPLKPFARESCHFIERSRLFEEVCRSGYDPNLLFA